MTDNEIKEAFERCMESYIEIFERQKAEIERLTIEFQAMTNAVNSHKKNYETAIQKKRNEENEK